MTPQETSRLIDAAGGSTALARLLGFEEEGAPQRVNNWKRRGMPAAVVLEHYDLIRRLREEHLSVRKPAKAAAS